MYPNHHISKTVRIGEVNKDALFDIVWATEGPVVPIPWNQFVPETKGYSCDWTRTDIKPPETPGKFKDAAMKK
jgi:urea transport system substrate-binding protein